MDAQPGLDDQYRRSSSWPLFVALGLVISELGVLFGVIPISVGGLVLFIGAIAAAVSEAGYTDRPWRLLAGLGGLLVGVGVLIAVTQASALAPAAVIGVFAKGFAQPPNGVVVRGISIIVAGIAGIVLALVGPQLATTPR